MHCSVLQSLYIDRYSYVTPINITFGDNVFYECNQLLKHLNFI